MNEFKNTYPKLYHKEHLRQNGRAVILHIVRFLKKILGHKNVLDFNFLRIKSLKKLNDL